MTEETNHSSKRSGLHGPIKKRRPGDAKVSNCAMLTGFFLLKKALHYKVIYNQAMVVLV
jgi:hypothetical protein